MGATCYCSPCGLHWHHGRVALSLLGSPLGLFWHHPRRRESSASLVLGVVHAPQLVTTGEEEEGFIITWQGWQRGSPLSLLWHQSGGNWTSLDSVRGTFSFPTWPLLMGLGWDHTFFCDWLTVCTHHPAYTLSAHDQPYFIPIYFNPQPSSHLQLQIYFEVNHSCL